MRLLMLRFRSDQRGAVAVIAASAMVAMFGFAALAIDYGMLTVDRRRAQSAADLAALAAAADLPRAEQAALATIGRNGVALDGSPRVEIGLYVPDPRRPASERFVAGAAPSANAVRVTLQTRSELLFARAISGQRDMAIRTSATAATSAFASFAIGSRLASLDGGLINSLLGSLLGTQLSLDTMDYRALLDSRIDLFRFLPMLADRARITAANYDQLLASNVRMVDLIGTMATATLTPEGGSTAASRALNALLRTLAGSSHRIQLASIISVGPYTGMPVGEVPAASASIGALHMLMAAAQVASGARQVEFELGVDLPGITGATVSIAIGERPTGNSWIAIGPAGASVKTAQTRLLLAVRLAGAGGIASVTLPLYLELASATARLLSIDCAFPDSSRSSMSIGVEPAVVNAWIGQVPPRQMVDFTGSVRPEAARLVSTPLLRVHGRAHVAVANMKSQTVKLSVPDIDRQTRKTVGTTDFTRSLLTRLVGDLDLDVEALGLGVGLPGPVRATVMGIISSATPSVDQLVSRILQTLGIGLGEADVWGLSLRCDGAVLVQ